MNKVIILFSLVSVYLNSGCKSPKETTAEAPAVKPAQKEAQVQSSGQLQATETTAMVDAVDPTPAKENAQDAKNKVYDLVVSFFSRGEGIDWKAQGKLDQFLSGKNDSYTVENFRWGREGEVDYCFDFGKISMENKSKMKAQIISFVKDNPLVIIEENIACRHKK